MANADGERDGDESAATQSSRNVRAKLTHPSSPRSRSVAIEPTTDDLKNDPEEPGPKKARVIVKDVAYTTYRAVLYYVRRDYLSLICVINTPISCTPTQFSLHLFPHLFIRLLHHLRQPHRTRRLHQALRPH
jgi:hypothetical protein